MASCRVQFDVSCVQVVQVYFGTMVKPGECLRTTSPQRLRYLVLDAKCWLDEETVWHCHHRLALALLYVDQLHVYADLQNCFTLMAYKENWVTEASSYFDKMSQIESLNKTRQKECESKMTCSTRCPPRGKDCQTAAYRHESHTEKMF